MALNETISQQLDEWKPAEGRTTLNVDEGGCSVAVTADRNDELGTLAWEVAVKRPADAPGTVKTWAEGCAARVTGLPEPLKVLEIDDQRDEAVLRSAKATRRGDSQYYYEVSLKGTTEGQPAPLPGDRHPSQPVTFPITHEALGRVIEGIAARSKAHRLEHDAPASHGSPERRGVSSVAGHFRR